MPVKIIRIRKPVGPKGLWHYQVAVSGPEGLIINYGAGETRLAARADHDERAKRKSSEGRGPQA